ncbi:MAG TPA: amidohydrolase family protein [Gemmatimonadaceae bacterium]|nr:amidohydrolase family protein [Gemmatimonadaceae bacterium]
MRRRLTFIALAVCLAATISPARAQNRAEAGGDTILYSVVFSGKTMAGVQKTWRDKDGTHFFLEYNDRGRGPQVTEDVKLDAAGVPVSTILRGHDYFKNPVDEHFRVENGAAAWHGSAESGSVPDRRAFYLSFDGAPGEYALLINAMLKAPSHRATLLPAGDATLEHAGERVVSNSGRTMRVTQYLISGIGYTPQPVWMDMSGELFAVGGTWTMTIRKGWESFIPQLVKAQDSAAEARSVRLARELRRKPVGAVVFRNARLFDADSGTMRDHMTVVVSGNRISAVGSSTSVAIPANAEVIDIAGKTLMPGLWDMHVHTDDTDGMHHIAGGVTTVRDMANDTEELMQRRKRFDEGSLIGPRIVMAGFMDGPGPFAGPTKVLVDNEKQARDAVNHYADLGYVQIKIYSSIKPELVPAIIDQAHKRHLRVSGHVPAFMTAEQVVKLGIDELQHANFLFLNFWGDSIKDTRTPLRFTAVAERAGALDLRSPRVASFLSLLKNRGVVVDPTLNVFEGLFTARRGSIMAGDSIIADRLPPVVRRGLLAGGLPVPEGKDSIYRSAFPAMLKMVKMLYDAGIPIVAGTDAPAGFALHRELELYSKAGIPNAEVLRIATIGAARVVHMDDRLGSIKPGKLADLIVVDGDPVRNIRDIRRVELTMKDGIMHESAKVYRALGVQPVTGR